jgi:hypothetical protein
VTHTDFGLLLALAVIFVCWSGAWYRQRAQSWAARRYLSALAAVLTTFVVVFAVLHYLWRIA